MLMLWVYQLGMAAFTLAMRIIALWHTKVRKGVQGRKNWRNTLAAARQPGETWVWMHCASLGEFEQGRNLVEALKAQKPDLRVLITFFSPSGYEVRATYRHADAVLYLPFDTPRNVRDWLDILQPSLVFFIKYELWINYLLEMQRRDIPLLLVSARVTSESQFLRSPLSPLYRRAFGCFTHIFTQDQATLALLRDFAGHERLSVSSDTRYDRVRSNREGFTPLAEIEAFVQNRLCLVVGSSWPKEEELVHQAFDALAERFDLCMILAPHEIHADHIDQWIQRYPEMALTHSRIEQLQPTHRILWVDRIGLLSRLYHYADVAYVGGGWGTGLHNILEPAVFGCPVIFGPEHRKFPEAAELIAAGGGVSIDSGEALTQQLIRLLADDALRQDIQQRNEAFVADRSGATAHILGWLREWEVRDQ